MKRSFSPTAGQIVRRSGFGGLISACGPLVLLSTSHQPRGLIIFAEFAISCALTLGGVYIAYMANCRLANGISGELWKQEDVNFLRALLQSRWFLVLHLALLLGFVLFVVPWSHSWRRFAPMGWSFFLLGQNLLQLSNTTRRRPGADRKPTWSDLSPIRSQHWGK